MGPAVSVPMRLRRADRVRYDFPAMNKLHYYFKLIPPRPTFPHDITDEESTVMQKHSAYFEQQFAAGKLLLYGPVMAREGAFGIGVLEVENEAEARRFGESDPSVLSGLNRFELCPMRVVASRAKT
jgi:uncharacterized protein